jgi:hypothetical protein
MHGPASAGDRRRTAGSTDSRNDGWLRDLTRLGGKGA